MKNLDLNAYGVEEMNANEMERIDGGLSLESILGIGLLALAYGAFILCAVL